MMLPAIAVLYLRHQWRSMLLRTRTDFIVHLLLMAPRVSRPHDVMNTVNSQSFGWPKRRSSSIRASLNR